MLGYVVFPNRGYDNHQETIHQKDTNKDQPEALVSTMVCWMAIAIFVSLLQLHTKNG